MDYIELTLGLSVIMIRPMIPPSHIRGRRPKLALNVETSNIQFVILLINGTNCEPVIKK